MFYKILYVINMMRILAREGEESMEVGCAVLNMVPHGKRGETI